MKFNICPCCSNVLFERCCQKYLNEHKYPDTAEQLMRSRYSAYAAKNSKYIMKTWHFSSQPITLDLDNAVEINWTQLYILQTSLGKEYDQSGSVEFVAYNQIAGKVEKLHEISQFVKENNRWYYLDGKIMTQSSFSPSRNLACYCGSGKKFKHCCINQLNNHSTK